MDETPARGDYIGLTDDRLRHMREVGIMCHELGGALYGWGERRCRQLFLMGFLHDVGYQFAPTQSLHERIGGQLLREAGFTLGGVVALHGAPEAAPYSPELFIVNVADMSVSSDGRRVTFAERLAGIADRYGEESPQVKRAGLVVSHLEQRLQDIGASQASLISRHYCTRPGVPVHIGSDNENRPSRKITPWQP